MIKQANHAVNASSQGQRQDMQVKTNGHIRSNSKSIEQCKTSMANMPASQAMQRTTHHTEQLAGQRVKHTEKSEQHSTHTHKQHMKHNSMQAAGHNNSKGTTHSNTKGPNISKPSS